MRIPTYDSNAKAPAVGNYAVDRNLYVPDVRQNTFGEIANGLENYSKIVYQQEEEARKTEYFKADMAIQAEIMDAKSKMFDSIQNGGSYKGAEELYQKQHDAIVGKYADTFKSDPNVYERSMAEYKRMGVGNTVELRNVVQARRKSDGAASTNLMLERASQLYLQDPKKSIEMASRAVGGAQSVGIFGPDEAKLKMIKFIQSGSAMKMADVFIQNRDTPEETAKWVEANKDNLDVSVYLTGKEKAQREIESVANVKSVQNYMVDPVVNKVPAQESVDLYFQRELAPLSQTDQAGYEQKTVELAVSTGKLPDQLAQQASSYLDMDASTMSAADFSTVASNARIISEANKHAAKLSKTNLSADTIAKSNLLVQRMEAGMPVNKAVMSVQRDLGNDEAKKLYSASLTEARNIILEKKVNGNRIDADVPTYAQSDFINAYTTAKMNTASASEAARAAQREIKSRYTKFNGVLVKDPPMHVSTKQYDEQSWVKAANAKYEEKLGKIPDGSKAVLMADRETLRMKNSGEEPSYPLFISYSKDEHPIPVFDKTTGQPIRVTAIPKEMKTVKKIPDEAFLGVTMGGF